MSFHGLNQSQLQIIKEILIPFAPLIDHVGLFGSRATGTYRENSDIDLVIYGDIKQEIADRLWTLFDESDLPVTVDLQVYALIEYPPLKDHVDAAMRPLFSKADLI